VVIAFLILVVALVVLVLAAVGVTNTRVSLVPLGLALAVLAELVRWWPPP